MLRHFHGIMFDMDNTLLASKIDFKKMKSECLRIIQDEQINGWQKLGAHMTSSQLIELAVAFEKEHGERGIVDKMFSAVVEIETEGMSEAVLEPGAMEVVKRLSEEKTLVIVTNNATSAAVYALERLNIAHYFADIYGRDRMGAMKPAPESILSVLTHYPQIENDKWVMVGDSWIDGCAAQGANVRYICYNGSKPLHEQKQVSVFNYITTLQQLL